MPQTIDESPAFVLTRLVFQTIQHAAVLVVEKLQDRSVSLLCLYHIIILLLQSVHRSCILVEIARKNYQVFIRLKVLRILIKFLVHEILHLFCLLVACHKSFNIKRYSLAIIACLEVRME